MIFVQYFQQSTGYDYKTGSINPDLIKPIEACGDRAVIILDGRQSIDTWHCDAKQANGVRRPVYCGYVLYKGSSFSNAKPISQYNTLN